MRKINYRNHILAILITIGIFVFVFYLTNFVQNRGLENIERIERSVALNILSIETQFALFQNVNCEDVADISFSSELDEIGQNLASMESNRDINADEIAPVKKYYTLLEIKDYQLLDEIGKRCGIKKPTILYFYGNDCDDCRRQGLILSRLKNSYPDIRIYSFDRDIPGFNAVRTLEQIFKIDTQQGDVPIIVIDEVVHYGFQSIENITTLVPSLDELDREYLIRDEIRDWAQENLENGAKNFEIQEVADGIYQIAYEFRDSWFAGDQEASIIIRYSVEEDEVNIKVIENDKKSEKYEKEDNKATENQ